MSYKTSSIDFEFNKTDKIAYHNHASPYKTRKVGHKITQKATFIILPGRGETVIYKCKCGAFLSKVEHQTESICICYVTVLLNRASTEIDNSESDSNDSFYIFSGG
jgi:hypothetical protein